MEGSGRYDEMFRVEYPRLVRTATLILGDVEQAREMAQESMLKLLQEWPRVSSHDRPGAWARRVCIRLAVRARDRRGKVAAAVVLASAGSTAESSDTAGVDVWEAVLALPTQQRAAIVLRYVEDLPTDEIAELLSCDAATVRVHLHRARKTLGLALREEVEDVVG